MFGFVEFGVEINVALVFESVFFEEPSSELSPHVFCGVGIYSFTVFELPLAVIDGAVGNL